MLEGSKGKAFWGKFGDNEPTEHIRFIITDPDPEGDVLVVNATSYHGYRSQDPSCIIDNDDYDALSKRSYINYREAEVHSEFDITRKAMRRIIIVEKDKISKDLLKKIQDGAKASYDLPTELFKYFDYF